MKDPKPQINLFDKGEVWEEAWQGMPEFVQNDAMPFKTVYVHFENRKDVDAFSALVKQTIGMNTKSIWYPEAEIGHVANLRYVDTRVEKLEDEPGGEEDESQLPRLRN